MLRETPGLPRLLSSLGLLQGWVPLSLPGGLGSSPHLPAPPSTLQTHPTPISAVTLLHLLVPGLIFFTGLGLFFKGRETYFSVSTVICKEWFLSVSCLHVGGYFSVPRVWEPPETTKVPGTGLAFVPLACLFHSFF